MDPGLVLFQRLLLPSLPSSSINQVRELVDRGVIPWVTCCTTNVRALYQSLHRALCKTQVANGYGIIVWVWIKDGVKDNLG